MTDNTITRVDLSTFVHGNIIVGTETERTLVTALRAAYAENDRLEAEMKPMLVQMESFLEFAAKHSQALALVEALTNFLADAEKAGKPMTTQLVVGTPENSLPLIHLWATTDDQDPVARGRYLREENDNLKVEIDRLRASALTWTTVTDDPATLPEQDSERDVLVDTVRWDDGEPSEMRTYYVLHLEFDSIENLSPGDRWAYIPEAPDADS